MTNDNNPFLYDTMSRWQLCRFCMHLHNLLGELRCAAFPQGIPRIITSGQIIHNEPLPEQKNALVFKPW